MRRSVNGMHRRAAAARPLAAAGWAAGLVLLMAGGAAAADSDDPIITHVDALIRQAWVENGVEPSAQCSDNEFSRRACLDIVGHIPSVDTLAAFLADSAPDKRRRLIDQLLDDPDYERNWSTIWANLLVGRRNNRGSRPFLEQWLRDALHRNVAYDRFVYDLIAAEGDNADNGAVNFLSAHLNDGAVPATAITARLFLGLQVQCTQCHNHPFNDWKQTQFWGLNAFFKGTRIDGGGGRGEFTLRDAPGPNLVFFEKRSGLEEAIGRQFVDGTLVTVTGDDDHPRRQLAELITDPARPYLARTQVNRMWGHFFGFGFTKPVDDMGPHNAPSHAELLDYLSSEFTKAGFDNKRLIRWITASAAYNLTSRAGANNQLDDPNTGTTPHFSRMYIKSFSAEQLYDSLLVATDADKANRNEEAARNQRRAWLSQFIQAFGTDENDETTTFNGTVPQALVLMNGELIQNALSDAPGGFLHRLLAEDPPQLASLRRKDLRAKRSQANAKPDRPKPAAPEKPRRSRARPAAPLPPVLRNKLDALFLAALARFPTDEEENRLYSLALRDPERNPIHALQDVFWAVLNSNEFIINH